MAGEMVVAAWAIWTNRNKFIHEKQRLDEHQTTIFIGQFIADFKEANSSLPTAQTLTLRGVKGRWRAPPPGTFKMNIDSAIFVDLGGSGVGAIIRDSNGQCLLTFTEFIWGIMNATKIEALALARVVAIASEIGFHDFEVESDSSTVVKAANTKEFECASFGHIIDEARSLMRPMGVSVCSHIPRTCNSVAHELEKFARVVRDRCVWFEEVPSEISSFLENDFAAL